MSTESIYGTWDVCQHPYKKIEQLWHLLAAQHVGQADFQPNSGLSQRKNEIIELWQLFDRQQPHLIVEIGVAQGGTLAGWCQLAPDDAEFIVIDRCLDDCRPRAGDPVHPSISNWQGTMTSAGGGAYKLLRAQQQLHCINGWTTDVAIKEIYLAALNGRKVDFMFHDASHDMTGFTHDFDFFWPTISEGGIMAIHDIQPSSHPDVTKSLVWNRIKATADYSACYEYRGSRTSDSLGIGILIR